MWENILDSGRKWAPGLFRCSGLNVDAHAKCGTMFRYWNIPVAGKDVSYGVQSDLTEPALVRPTWSSQLHFVPFFLQGNAGHHEGYLRHDGEMHVPHPQRGDSAPARWSVLPGKWATCSQHSGTNLESLALNLLFSLWQKMDKNKDGVVTIDEFIDCCQNVSWASVLTHLLLSFFFTWSHRVLLSAWRRMKTSCDRCTSLRTSSNWDGRERLRSELGPWRPLELILCTVCYAD